ncbi:MAG: hypothetical protein NVSMB19_03120 [Vulcanimicrobiaceae bacterium]
MRHWPHGDPDALVRDVLAGDAYRNAAVTSARAPQPGGWAALWAWLGEHVLRPLFAPLFHAFERASAAGFAPLLGSVLVIAALALLALVAFRLAVAVERATRGRARTSGLATPAAARRDAQAWRALARDAAARNDFARAIAALFAAALALLDERAVIPFDPARTPGEYRRAVRRDRALAAPAFDDLAARFVCAAYAPDRPGAAAYAEAERALDRFEPATRA